MHQEDRALSGAEGRYRVWLALCFVAWADACGPRASTPQAPASADVADTVREQVDADAGVDVTSSQDVVVAGDGSASDAETLADGGPEASDAGVLDAGVSDAGVLDQTMLYDGWLGVPVDPESLPLTAFTTVTSDYGVSSTKPHGACVAVNDVDGDGHQDVVIIEWNTKVGRVHTLLLGKPKVVHIYSAIDTTIFDPAHGCTLADITGDGHVDLLLAGFSGLSLLAGKGSGGFDDVSDDWLPLIMDFAAYSVAMVDLDGDGDLDVFVGAGMIAPTCESVDCTLDPKKHDVVCNFLLAQAGGASMQDRVLINGAVLPLQDETAAWNVPGGGPQTIAAGLDVDGDGKGDVLVCDDFGAHRVLRNTGGTFDPLSTTIGFSPYANAMGWGVGDFDGDGRPDLVVADSGPVAVYMQQAVTPGAAEPLKFIDRGGDMGVWWPTYGTNSWSPLVADFDHDGQDDLFIGAADTVPVPVLKAMYEACEFISSLFNPGAGSHAVDLLFLRNQHGAMVAHHIHPAPFAHFTVLAQQLVDLDGDGDLDIVQARPGPNFATTTVIRFLRNDLPKKGGSIFIRLQGKKANQDALGARITASIDGFQRTRWLSGSGGFGGSPVRMAHFGLGASLVAKDVVVWWPDGSKTGVGTVAAGKTVVVKWL